MAPVPPPAPLLPVPPELNLEQLVDREWKEIQQNVYDEFPIDAPVRRIQEAFLMRASLLEKKTLDERYGWLMDLEMARAVHQSNLDWLPRHQRVRDGYLQYWKDNCEKGFGYVREIAANGMKTILLIHGAVALGALNVISGGNSNLLIAAKFALLFSIVGIVMLAVGQMLMIEITSRGLTKIGGKLSVPIKWSKARAFHRYARRAYKYLPLTDKLIYGSAIWFCVYSGILYVLIVS